jgi:uncharacterized membrane protein
MSVKITPAADTADGSYPVAITATSSADATRTVTATVTCDIATSVTASVATDKDAYSPNQTVTITTTVQINGSPAVGVNVSLTMTRSDTTSVSATLKTGRKGTAVYKNRVAAKDPPGQYDVKTVATAGSRSAQGTATFTVGTTTASRK